MSDKEEAQAALQEENAGQKKRIDALLKAYDQEADDCLEALKERDYWYEKSDAFADKISEVFDVPIGEHSNVNCPIVEAMKILCGEYVTKFDKESAAQAKRIKELEAATEHLGLTPQQAKDGLARHKAHIAEYEACRKKLDAMLSKENAEQIQRIAELELSAIRYEKLRRLNAYQLQNIFKKNITSGARFDELVDNLSAQKGTE